MIFSASSSILARSSSLTTLSHINSNIGLIDVPVFAATEIPFILQYVAVPFLPLTGSVNISLANTLDIASDRELILDLNGYTLTTSKDDFSEIEVDMGEFYLSELVNKIFSYYKEKMLLSHIEFKIGIFTDCIIKGDLNRSIEVIQNLIENSIKYGDGTNIILDFAEEDNCMLISVVNMGCDLPENEILHIFDCFYRGSNSKNKSGSGLGLHICKKLMHKMNGDIFAELNGDTISVTVVFNKAN